jgi:hypothetical protein
MNEKTFYTIAATTTTLNEDAYELTLGATTVCKNFSFEGKNTIATDSDMLHDIAMNITVFLMKLLK